VNRLGILGMALAALAMWKSSERRQMAAAQPVR